jgi:hypothetical protein
MYSVYFENQNGIMRTIGTARSVNLCMALIDEFLKEHNFKSYYKRLTNVEFNTNRFGGKMTKIDVGSHVEFFYIKPPIAISTIGDNK